MSEPRTVVTLGQHGQITGLAVDGIDLSDRLLTGQTIMQLTPGGTPLLQAVIDIDKIVSNGSEPAVVSNAPPSAFAAAEFTRWLKRNIRMRGE